MEQLLYEVIKADYEIPVGPNGEFSELFLEEQHAYDFAESNNVKLLKVGKTKITESDYKTIFNID